jgi:hypothetical protein
MVRKLQETARGSGNALRSMVERTAGALRDWLASPWDARRVRRAVAALTAAVALGWAWRRLGAEWWNQARWGRRKHGTDPVRREAGRWLRQLQWTEDGSRRDARRRRGPPTKAAQPEPEREVMQDLERLRYGPRESWPEPRQVFREARKTQRDRLRHRS